MSDKEDAQKFRMLQQHAEAKAALAQLRAQARNVGQTLSQIGAALSKDPDNVNVGQGVDYGRLSQLMSVPIDELSGKQIRELVLAINGRRSEIERLESQMRAANVPFGS